MACPTLTIELNEEVKAAMASHAESDALAVAAFLSKIYPKCEGPLKLPAAFLMGLGQALRLLRWEQQGIFLHREYGLPGAEEAIKNIVMACANMPHKERDEFVCRFCNQVWFIIANHFAVEAPALGMGTCCVQQSDDESILLLFAKVM
jgi:hypothetical protein